MSTSSREIAELVGKEHRHVLADIRSMMLQLDIESAEFSADWIDARGRVQQEFMLPKVLTFTLVLGYDVKRRYAVSLRGGPSRIGRRPTFCAKRTPGRISRHRWGRFAVGEDFTVNKFVDRRDLWRFVESGQDFSTWIRGHIWNI